MLATRYNPIIYIPKSLVQPLHCKHVPRKTRIESPRRWSAQFTRNIPFFLSFLFLPPSLLILYMVNSSDPSLARRRTKTHKKPCIIYINQESVAWRMVPCSNRCSAALEGEEKRNFTLMTAMIFLGRLLLFLVLQYHLLTLYVGLGWWILFPRLWLVLYAYYYVVLDTYLGMYLIFSWRLSWTEMRTFLENGSAPSFRININLAGFLVGMDAESRIELRLGF